MEFLATGVTWPLLTAKDHMMVSVHHRHQHHNHHYYPHNHLITPTGIGGCLKRTTAKEALCRTVNNQIIEPREVFDFCNERVKGIVCFWVPKGDIENLCIEKLDARYEETRTIPGTLRYHFFQPIFGTSKVLAKVVSSDQQSDEHETKTQRRR